MKVVVRDLPYDTTEHDIRQLFEPHGDAVSIELPVDHITGQPKGTAIVEMATLAEAEDAVHHLRHRPFRGRHLRLKLAKQVELAEAAPSFSVDEERRSKPHPRALPRRPERSPGTRARRSG